MDIKDSMEVFIKEDPFSLNEKMETIQQIKFGWFKKYAKAGEDVAQDRALIQSCLQNNYSEAIGNTKKNASMESLEAWACANKMEEYPDIWADYIKAKENLLVASRILTTLEADLSSLQTRCRIFEK